MSATSGRQGHRCPRRGCTEVVSNRLFCCLADWQALPVPAQRAISRTGRMSLLSEPRREAIAAARQAWDALDQRS